MAIYQSGMGDHKVYMSCRHVYVVDTERVISTSQCSVRT